MESKSFPKSKGRATVACTALCWCKSTQGSLWRLRAWVNAWWTQSSHCFQVSAGDGSGNARSMFLTVTEAQVFSFRRVTSRKQWTSLVVLVCWISLRHMKSFPGSLEKVCYVESKANFIRMTLIWIFNLWLTLVAQSSFFHLQLQELPDTLQERGLRWSKVTNRIPGG